MKINIAVIFGGRSVEHEISVLSASQCISALDKSKYDIIPIYISKKGQWYTGDALLHLENYQDIDKLLGRCTPILFSQNANEHLIFRDPPHIFSKNLLAKIDVIFPVMHGSNGEDGTLQGLLELINLPYVGSNVLASSVCMDKIITKMVLKEINVPTLDFFWFYSHEWIENKEKIITQIKNKFAYPLIVKPANLGSSIGVTAVNNDEQLEDAIDLAVSMTTRIMVEPKIEALREINCSVLGDFEKAETSILEEPIRGEQILSFNDKYMSGSKAKGIGGTKVAAGGKLGMSGLKRKIPAEISEELATKIREYAKKSFIALNCAGVVRIDFLLDQRTNNIFLCELNTIPGSLAFYLWKPVGKDFTQLLDRLIELARIRHRRNSNLTTTYNTNILALQGKQ